MLAYRDSAMRIPPEKQGYRKLVTIHSALRLASRRTGPGLNPLGSQLLDDAQLVNYLRGSSAIRAV